MAEIKVRFPRGYIICAQLLHYIPAVTLQASRNDPELHSLVSVTEVMINEVSPWS